MRDKTEVLYNQANGVTQAKGVTQDSTLQPSRESKHTGWQVLLNSKS